MIKVSVIIPVYNMGNYIRECLDSVMRQTLKDIEVICIDDGSTDCSYDILMEYHKKYKNLTVIYQDNQGAAMAKNRGLECAHGKYICFMDPDDYYAQDQALELLYFHAEKNQAFVCGGDFVSIADNGKQNRPKKWFSENGMISFADYGDYYYYTSYIYRAELIRENNIIFPPYRRYEDPPFLLNIMIHAQKFYAVNEMIYAYRVGHKSEKYPLTITLDVLKGIRDCFKMAKKNNLLKVYEEQLKGKLEEYLDIIYPHAKKGQKEVWDLIYEINEISMDWRGEVSAVFADCASMEAYVFGLMRERNHIISECRAADHVVIYGAGTVGKYFLQSFGKECKRIDGFAVSRKQGDIAVDGYAVKEIGDYDREALVFIAVSRQYAEEIVRNLESLQFKKICYAAYEDLEMAERICHYLQEDA